VCQAFINKSIVHASLHPILPLGAFEKWGINLMGPFPITQQNYRFLVVAIDYFTRCAKLKPFKTSKKEEVARFLYKRIVTCFGILLEMVLDDGP
jgi:hypothetical protein